MKYLRLKFRDNLNNKHALIIDEENNIKYYGDYVIDIFTFKSTIIRWKNITDTTLEAMTSYRDFMQGDFIEEKKYNNIEELINEYPELMLI